MQMGVDVLAKSTLTYGIVGFSRRVFDYVDTPRKSTLEPHTLPM